MLVSSTYSGRFGFKILVILLFFVFVFEPVLVTAQSRGGSWWRHNLPSESDQKVDSLAQLPATQLPIPVLLGVEITNLTRNFSDPRSGGTRTHEGLDIMAPLGTPVASPTDAVVTSTGNGTSAGLYVRTVGPAGETFVFMHLSQIGKGIDRGVILSKGDILGFVGNTGNASGGATHLHFEIQKNGATDPYPRLTEVFTLAEKMLGIEKALLRTDDTTLPTKWVANFRKIFESARSSGLAIPQTVLTLLDSNTVSPAPVSFGTVVEKDNPTLFDFSRNLTVGSTGEDVRQLQIFLNSQSFFVAHSGVGSPGKETTYFGNLTRLTLARYQLSHGITPSVGYFGPITRAYISS